MPNLFHVSQQTGNYTVTDLGLANSTMQDYVQRLTIQRYDFTDYAFDVQMIICDRFNIIVIKSVRGICKGCSIAIKDGYVLLIAVTNGSVVFSFGTDGTFQLVTGQYSLVYNGGRSFSISGGQIHQFKLLLVLIPPDDIERHLTLINRAVSFSTARKKQQFWQLSSEPLFIHSGMYDLIRHITDVPYSTSTGILYERICILLLKECLIPFIMTESREKNSQQQTEAAVMAAIKIIERNLDIHYTIPKLAKMTGINEQQLKYGFKSVTGSSIYQYVKQQRMAGAHEMISITKLPLKKIAYHFGYSNVQAFSRVFKSFFGHSPGMLRKRDITQQTG